MDDLVRAVGKLLASTHPEDVQTGLEKARARLPRADEEERLRYVEMAATLFYIDTLEHPEYLEVVEDAISLVASVGAPAIPVLMQQLEGGDVKSQMAVGVAMGRMDADAIQPLIAQYHNACPEPGCRSFVLYALGKIRSPRVIEALPIALEAAAAPDQELRDSATRSLGKFAESIPAGRLSAEVRDIMIDRLRANLSDVSPAIRAKAIRSLGKLSHHGHLTREQQEDLVVTCRRLLGEDEHYEWDRAYVVRKEAREALQYA